MEGCRSECVSTESDHLDGGVNQNVFDPRLEGNLAAVRERLELCQGWSWAPSSPSSLPPRHCTLLPESPSPTFPPCSAAIRDKLAEAWKKMHKTDAEGKIVELTPLQELLQGPMLAGMDVYDLGATTEEQAERRKLYCLHIINEVLRLRSRIIRNNERLAESPELELRDQGFARPRILILAPFRNTARDIVATLGKLWTATGGQVDNQKRLGEEFGPSDDDINADKKRRKLNQPLDFVETFRDNIDDCFRMGIKCTRKAMKLFCDFYTSDIIVASPLGLRFILDGQSETKTIKLPNGKIKKKRIVKKGDADFLSSIQMLVIEQADVIMMQNWEHVLHIVDFVNRLPKNSHGCDFSRIQSIFLDGLAKNTRQNIIFSEFPFPELNSLTNSLANCVGKAKFFINEYPGILKACSKKAKPQLHLVPSKSLKRAAQDRFEYFIEKVFSTLSQSATHVCIFISSYLDFVQVREHFKSTEVSHCILSEYCSPQEISASRTKFFNGQCRVLLVSERFHFFKRYRIRGIKRLIFFSLPDHANYYQEWCDFLEEPTDVPLLLSPLDYLKAERIIGTKRIRSLDL